MSHVDGGSATLFQADLTGCFMRGPGVPQFSRGRVPVQDLLGEPGKGFRQVRGRRFAWRWHS